MAKLKAVQAEGNKTWAPCPDCVPMLLPIWGSELLDTMEQDRAARHKRSHGTGLMRLFGESRRSMSMRALDQKRIDQRRAMDARLLN